MHRLYLSYVRMDEVKSMDNSQVAKDTLFAGMAADCECYLYGTLLVIIMPATDPTSDKEIVTFRYGRMTAAQTFTRIVVW